MRVFWTCIGVLMLLAGAMLAARSARTHGEAVRAVETAAAERQGPPERRAAEVAERGEPGSGEQAREPRIDGVSMGSDRDSGAVVEFVLDDGEDGEGAAEALSQAGEANEPVEPEASELTAPAPVENTMAPEVVPEPEVEKPDEEPAQEPKQTGEGEAPRGTEVPEEIDEAPAVEAVEEPAAAPDEAANEAITPQEVPEAPVTTERVAEKRKAAAPKPPVVWEQEDGSLLINGKYVVRGKGTEREPYELPWELLVAAREEYNPRDGKNTLPAWSREFQDTHVKITGYLLLPLVGETFDELLVMRNQWDGCCIGVPPTAYDAVEVKLATTSTLSRLQVNYGSISGVFKVDPYLSGKWLIGLYLMEECKLADMSGVGVGGQ